MCTGMTSFNRPDDWISVKDRLPDTDRDVIACSDLGDVFECWYHTVGKYWVKDGIIVVKDITHWRELPDPLGEDAVWQNLSRLERLKTNENSKIH